MEQGWLQKNWFKAGLLVALLALGCGIIIFAVKYEPKAPEKPPQIINIEQATSTAHLAGRLDVATVVKKWYPAIARVDCFFKENDEKVYVQSGSGFLADVPESLRVLTNRHILIDEDAAMQRPQLCEATLPGSEESYLARGDLRDDGSSDLHLSTSTLDWAYIKIGYPVSGFTPEVARGLPLCGERRELGTPVIILGYPGVGSKTDVTVTQGIISGYDGDYYISDAKIGRGSSGGVAIGVDLDSNQSCLLGIPTFAEIGEVISLARVLDIRSVAGEGGLK